MIREPTIFHRSRVEPERLDARPRDPRPLARPGPRSTRRPGLGKPFPARRSERFAALDNARFVLIALVVVGHLLEQLVNAGPLASTLYRWIYLFHMPAFVLISGAVAKPFMNRRRAVALATGLLLPYVVFQTLYPAWNAWLSGSGDWSQGYLTPYWLLWYLPSLACWRLLLPLYARLGCWALPLAVVVALAAGCAPWIGYPFSLSRTLVFFPLFLLGYSVGAPALQRLGGVRGSRFAALGVLLAAAIGAWWLRGADPRWLYASFDYAALGAGPLVGGVTRMALLAASAACALAVLALVPRRLQWAGAGQRSLDAYLLHGFLVRAAVAGGTFAWLATVLPAPAEVALCLVSGALIAATLSTRGVDRVARPLLQPVPWLRRMWNAHAIREPSRNL